MRVFKAAFGILTVFIFLLALLVPNVVDVKGSVRYELISSYPLDGAKYVPNGTELSLVFGAKVTKVNPDLVKVYYKRSTYDVKTKIRTVIDNNTVKITPEESLLGDRTYYVELAPYAITFDNGLIYPTSKKIRSFSTDYYSFKELFVDSESKLTSLLVSYLPREITVSAPKRYIENVSILHKKKGTVGKSSSQAGSVTNFDIKTKQDEVSRVRIDIVQNGSIKQSKHLKVANAVVPNLEQGKFLFSLGLNKLPDSFDVNVYVYDIDNQVIDNKILKVVSQDGVLSIEETYQYQTAGKTYTLYDLLKNASTLNTLMEENEMKRVMVQVEKR
ncbi:Ig-like domain-containing protein [Peribacillus alkalitolerans]|uniref:Ig-like domain-containing protein n=1 Tax=Peribacillus alkalitolerans TaxID=1550385 RepID=UPI0013D07FFD|nr:Ig-like domain-containing protein [Peribacillus alkalitolerans]